MDIPDVATTGGVGAGSFHQGRCKIRVVDIADRSLDEMATADRPVAIDGNHPASGGTRFTKTGVILIVEGKK